LKGQQNWCAQQMFLKTFVKFLPPLRERGESIEVIAWLERFIIVFQF
jgi:hypothetical protein